MTATTKKPRARRIAADEAHSWARNLRLRNSLAKLVLSMTTLYVNGDGVCHPSIKALAEDTELSEETVRRRLAWLEQVGAIVRMPHWIDEHGRRNSDGRGKRTTDEIRLLIEADPDVIEARSCGAIDDDSDAVSPVPQTGLNPSEPARSPQHAERATDSKNLPSPHVSPPVALSLRTGAESSEPEQEPNPPTPQGGTGAEPSVEQEEEIEGWQEFKETFEADENPILRVSIAMTIFSAFTPEERRLATKAAAGLIAKRASERKPGAKPSAQTFLREPAAWPAFAKLAPPDPVPKVTIHRGTVAYKAVSVFMMLLTRRPLDVESIEVRRSLVEAPDILALSPFANEDGSVDLTHWLALDKEKHKAQIGAWRERIKAKSGAWIDLEKIPVLDPATGEQVVHVKEWNGQELRFPQFKEGLRVPKPWPPRTDGSWPEVLASDDDLDHFAKTA